MPACPGFRPSSASARRWAKPARRPPRRGKKPSAIAAEVTPRVERWLDRGAILSWCEGKSSKFWEIALDGGEVTVRFGRSHRRPGARLRPSADAEAAQRMPTS